MECASGDTFTVEGAKSLSMVRAIHYGYVGGGGCGKSVVADRVMTIEC